MKSLHAALILISSDLVAGMARIRDIKNEISQLGEIKGVSCIYKRFLNQRSEDLNSELVLVVKIETTLPEQNLFQNLKAQENNRSNQQITDYESLVLLCYDNQVRMFPGQNLPSPLLHSDRLALRCASEVWGNYEHPVLGKTLSDMVKSNEALARVEFFAQGSSLM